MLDITRLFGHDLMTMTVAETIRTKLEAAFSPVELRIIDESRLHQGHAGAHPGGESHFRVTIVSSMFQGLSRVERQRRVHQVLADELKSRVHALSLTLSIPGE